jgi:hypothetical protein
VYLVNVYWFSSAIGQQDYRDVANSYSPNLVSHWLKRFANCTPSQGKVINTAPNSLNKTPAASQLIFIHLTSKSPLVITVIIIDQMGLIHNRKLTSVSINRKIYSGYLEEPSTTLI